MVGFNFTSSYFKTIFKVIFAIIVLFQFLGLVAWVSLVLMLFSMFFNYLISKKFFPFITKFLK